MIDPRIALGSSDSKIRVIMCLIKMYMYLLPKVIKDAEWWIMFLALCDSTHPNVNLHHFLSERAFWRAPWRLHPQAPVIVKLKVL